MPSNKLITSPSLARRPYLSDDPLVIMKIILLIAGSSGAGVVGNESEDATNWILGEVNLRVNILAINETNLLKT